MALLLIMIMRTKSGDEEGGFFARCVGRGGRQQRRRGAWHPRVKVLESFALASKENTRGFIRAFRSYFCGYSLLYTERICMHVLFPVAAVFYQDGSTCTAGVYSLLFLNPLVQSFVLQEVHRQIHLFQQQQHLITPALLCLHRRTQESESVHDKRMLSCSPNWYRKFIWWNIIYDERPDTGTVQMT